MPPVNTIANADCIAAMQDLPDGYVDLAFADPPFNIGYDYDVYDDRKERDEYLAWSKRWIEQVYRVLKPAGTFWLAIGDEYAAELKIAAQDAGFHCRSWVVWYYTFGVNCKRKFSRSHAHLFHFIKDAKDFTFNSEAIRVPSARQLVYNDGRANPKGRLPDDTWILRPQDCPSGFGADEDTWYFPRVAGTFKERAGFHGCQMPEQLLGRIIRCCTNDDTDEPDLVLDPFSGSATTVVVAKKLGRRFLGFDLSKEYAARGLDRLKATSVGDALVGAADPLTSAPTTAEGRPLEESRKPKSDSTVLAATRSVRPSNLKPLSGDIAELVGDAFRRVHRGFSVDFLLANPEMDAAFVDQCRKHGTSLTAGELNGMLLRLRKSGRLKVAATKRASIANSQIDKFVFASEISLRALQLEGYSLDQVLCDPSLADRFDAAAAMRAPGFTPFEYRWAALSVRKSYDSHKLQVLELDRRLRNRRGQTPFHVAEADISRIPSAEGVYRVFVRESGELYVGETENLRQRLLAQFIRASVSTSDRSPASDVEIALFPEVVGQSRIGLRFLLVERLSPIWNYRTMSESTVA